MYMYSYSHSNLKLIHCTKLHLNGNQLYKCQRKILYICHHWNGHPLQVLPFAMACHVAVSHGCEPKNAEFPETNSEFSPEN